MNSGLRSVRILTKASSDLQPLVHSSSEMPPLLSSSKAVKSCDWSIVRIKASEGLVKYS